MRHISLAIGICLLLTSCVVKNIVTGEYYLAGRAYKTGIKTFEQALAEQPDSPENHYYMARYCLGDNQVKKGLKHINEAVKLDPYNPDYLFWQGVAYGANKAKKAEWQSYEAALKINPAHVNARLYLAHTQLERKQYKAALSNYGQVLGKRPQEASALYNRALILDILGRSGEARSGWKIYLEQYWEGAMAVSAVRHLNHAGDFAFRNYLIGVRTLAMHAVEFTPFSLDLTQEARFSLNRLGKILDQDRNLVIHIVAYQKNNPSLAEKKAKKIKAYLLEQYPGIDPAMLKASWFDQAEKIKLNKKRYDLDESVRFITAV
ncbi:MAG: tetratricopeptide repeat protein [Desulfobacter sp.]|nr:MAG: tetratricopeptide repeat protein [Desulfobacter sp.]